MRNSFALIAIISIALMPIWSVAYAGTTVVGWADSGHYDTVGGHAKGNNNYIAGGVTSGDNHNYFIFDLSSVTGVITGANLLLSIPNSRLDGSPVPGITAAGTYTAYDVSTPIGDLMSDQTGRLDIYNDLGSGTIYGAQAYDGTESGTVTSIALNPAALMGLNSAIGTRVALGGSFSTLGAYIFGFTNNTQSGASEWTRELVLTSVPDPASATLMIVGLAGLAAATRRHRSL